MDLVFVCHIRLIINLFDRMQAGGWTCNQAAIASFLFRFFMAVSAELEAEVPGSAPLFGSGRPARDPCRPAF